MKVFKFFKVALVTGALAAMMVVPAFASKQNYSFDLLIEDGNAGHSSVNYKTDNEQRAYVYTTSGNIVSSDRVLMQIVSPYDDTAYTGSKQITSNSGRYLFDYTTYVGKDGGSRIYAITYKYDVKMSGYWYS